jgi:hypothetical protein
LEGLKENVTFLASLLALGIWGIKELYGRDRELIRELTGVIQNNTKAIQALDKRVSKLEWHVGFEQDHDQAN